MMPRMHIGRHTGALVAALGLLLAAAGGAADAPSLPADVLAIQAKYDAHLQSLETAQAGRSARGS